MMYLLMIPYHILQELLNRLNGWGILANSRAKNTAMTINKIFLGSDNHLWCGAWDNGLHQFDLNGKRLAAHLIEV